MTAATSAALLLTRPPAREVAELFVQCFAGSTRTSSPRSMPSGTEFALSLPEIVDPIVDWCVRKRLRLKYLARLAVVNQLFNQAATPVLYRKLDYRLEWDVGHMADRPSLDALVATLASRPSHASLVQEASVLFNPAMERQALGLLLLLPNLRSITLDARGSMSENIDAALLSRLPHITFVKVVLVQRPPDSMPADYLIQILGKAMGDKTIHLCVESIDGAHVARYISFVGDRISHLDLSVVQRRGPTATDTLHAVWDGILDGLPSLRTLRTSYRLSEQVSPDRLSTLAKLEHLDMVFYGTGLIAFLEMLADPAIWPKLRSTPGILHDKEQSSSELLNALASIADREARENECRRLIAAAKEGLRRRPFWTDSAVAPNPWS